MLLDFPCRSKKNTFPHTHIPFFIFSSTFVHFVDQEHHLSIRELQSENFLEFLKCQKTVGLFWKNTIVFWVFETDTYYDALKIRYRIFQVTNSFCKRWYDSTLMTTLWQHVMHGYGICQWRWHAMLLWYFYFLWYYLWHSNEMLDDMPM